VPASEGRLARLVEDDSDPELDYLKALYREDFRAAFAEALGDLASRERNLLRYHSLRLAPASGASLVGSLLPRGHASTTIRAALGLRGDAARRASRGATAP
jgi:hypothetical protein